MTERRRPPRRHRPRGRRRRDLRGRGDRQALRRHPRRQRRDDVDVERGSITALIGPNGAGKTTFFNLITGFYRPDRGHGPSSTASEISGSPPYVIARRGHGADLPDHEGAGADAGDRQHDARGARSARRAARQRDLPARPARAGARARSREEAIELLEVFNLTKLADSYAGHALGRPAQAARARPGADDASRASCCSTSRWRESTRPSARGCSTTCSGCARRTGVTFLFVEHDMEVVMNHSDRVDRDGGGPRDRRGRAATQVRGDQAVIDAYLGGQAQAGRQ